ncbi:MAG: hypothetical protein EXS16_00130 [Gemmataceae bacterium]|nr:hypothetical protein [Gemmataceae bacterium]
MKSINPWYGVVFAVCTVGLWGCNQQRAATINAKINELESRYTKLEEDYRTVQLANEQQRKRLTHLESQKSSLETEKTDLTRQVATLNTDRENLWKQVKIRSAERDNANANLVQFSKELQAFTVRVESALNTNTPLSGATIVPVSRRND